MIEVTRGNLLEADVEAIVNTVNTVGVMGKGIALQFKKAFPDNFAAYKRACDSNELHPGIVLVVANRATKGVRTLFNMPPRQNPWVVG